MNGENREKERTKILSKNVNITTNSTTNNTNTNCQFIPSLNFPNQTELNRFDIPGDDTLSSGYTLQPMEIKYVYGTNEIVIKRIYVNNDHVIMYFEGDDKPVISSPHDEPFDLEKGILMCIFKHVTGKGNCFLNQLCESAKLQSNIKK